MKSKYSYLIKNAHKLGARDAVIIKTDTVVTAPWVRLKCQYGCDEYGLCLTCPPYSPTPEQTQRVIEAYLEALLIHGDEWTDIREIVAKLEREAFLAGNYKAFGFGAGPCRLCKQCPLKLPCKHAEDARPSMEASGIDVFQTARNNGFTIEVLSSLRCEANYFGLLLLE